jgi:hypothetical protein
VHKYKKQSQIDPVDLEMNRLKGDHGLTEMKINYLPALLRAWSASA